MCVRVCVCAQRRSSHLEVCITARPCLSVDLASDGEKNKKGEQWDTVSVTLPVNNPAMPLVLSFAANDSRPLQSRQEIALFYGMERSGDKREREREGRRR